MKKEFNDTELKPFDNSNDVGYSREELGELHKIKNKGKIVLKIEEDKCWMCGKYKRLTSHHALPRHQKPVNNILIPLCQSCHNKINKEDVNGMYAYLYKISKIIEDNSNMVRLALENLNSLNEMKQKQMKGGKNK